MDLSYNPRPRFTEWIVKNGLLSSPFVVVDVGALGGISPRWEHFGVYLEAHGFDVLDEAIAPLKALQHPKHRYYTMGLGNEDGERTVYVAPDRTQTSFYTGPPSPGASARSVPIRRLDTLMAEGTIKRADFIKIDCEGFEPEILKGAQTLLRSDVIALEIETNFNTSPVLPQSHFGAVCEQLVPHGFTLFDLAFNRVPRPSFVERVRTLQISDAVTVARPATVNTLFYRDTAAASPDELLKCVAILEIYGMADTAYDVLLAGAGQLGDRLSLQDAADLLIRRQEPRQSVLRRILSRLRSARLV